MMTRLPAVSELHARRRERAIGWVLVVAVCAPVVPVRAADSPSLAAVADELIREGMPEVLAELLSEQPATQQVLLARAYLATGVENDVPKAEAAFRTAINAAESAGWPEDLKRRATLARWRIELGCCIADRRLADALGVVDASVGRAEIPTELVNGLNDAISEFRAAEQLLGDVTAFVGLAPETAGAQSVGEVAPALSRECSAALARSLTYRALAEPASSAAREGLVTEALRRFDALSRAAADESERYRAVLGAGLAFRASGRVRDAQRLLTSVADGASDEPLRCQARYELARAMAFAGQVDLAVQALAALEEGPGAPRERRLATLMRAYLVLRDRQSGEEAAADRRAAAESMQAAMAPGAPMSAVARWYVDKLLPHSVPLAGLSPPELRLAALRALGDGRFDRAAAACEALLAADARPGPQRDAAEFDLARCRVAQGREREAADIWLSLSKRSKDRPSASRAARAAIEVLQQLADRSGLDRDYADLGDACRTMIGAAPSGPETDELAWIGAGAFHRARRSDDARQMLGRIGAASGRYWDAQLATLRIDQADALARREGDSTAQRRDRAIELAARWEGLATKLSTARASDDRAAASLSLMRVEALLASADLLSEEWVGQYEACLQRIMAAEQIPVTTPVAHRFVNLRVRCYRALRDFARLDAALTDFLSSVDDATSGGLLLGLAGELEAEADQRAAEGDETGARQLAADAAPIVRRLVDWLRSRPNSGAAVSVSELSLARLLNRAGQADEALQLTTSLRQREPQNGAVLVEHAAALEGRARAAQAGLREARDAESAWAALLSDRRLRQTAPLIYWQARYHWLRWQLESGRAEEVAEGIQAEQVWEPELGGSPWRERLLELLDAARHRGGPP